MLGVVFGAQVAVVAVGPEDVLAVGAGVWLAWLFVCFWEGWWEIGDVLHVEVEADTARCLERVDLRLQAAELGGVASGYAFVGL